MVEVDSIDARRSPRAVGPPQDGHGEVAAEAEGDLERRADRAAPADARRAVEVAAIVRIGQVERRRDEAVADRQAGDRQLGGPRGAQEVPDLRLVGRAGHGVGVRAQGLPEGPALQGVIGPGGGAVDVDVIDLVGGRAGVGQGPGDQPGEVRGVGVQVGQVVGIGAERPAGDFGIRQGAAGPGVVLAFQDQDGRPLAHQEPGAAAVPGADGGGRVAIDPGEGPHLAEGAQDQGLQRGVAAAGEGQVADAAADQVGGLEDRDDPGGAGRHGGQARPEVPMTPGHQPRRVAGPGLDPAAEGGRLVGVGAGEPASVDPGEEAEVPLAQPDHRARPRVGDRPRVESGIAGRGRRGVHHIEGRRSVLVP